MYQLLYLNVFDTRMSRISKVSDTYTRVAIRDDTQQDTRSIPTRYVTIRIE